MPQIWAGWTYCNVEVKGFALSPLDIGCGTGSGIGDIPGRVLRVGELIK